MYHEISRNDDALSTVTEMAYSYPDFSSDELDLFFTIYKEEFDSLRHTMVILKTHQRHEISQRHRSKCLILQEHLTKTYQILSDLADKCLDAIDEHLLPNAKSNRNIANLKRMKGDVFRYLSECSSTETLQQNLANSSRLYKEALETCKCYLEPCDSVSMNTVLNMAVFEYQQMKNRNLALELLKNEMELIMCSSVELSEEQKENVAKTLDIMKTNYNAWNSIEH